MTEFQGAAPRVVGQKQKYKHQQSAQETGEGNPQNIMFDRRVFRGSTNAAMVIPSGSYPDQLFRSNKKKYDPKMIEQKRAQAAEEFFTRDVKTPEPPTGKQNIDIQTDQFVTELTDKAPMYEIACQTAFNIPEVKTPWAMPQLRGVSKKTLIEDNELFLFEDEVEPLLSVLCGKTLEQARMEVLEEEELAEMKRKQAQLENLNKLENADIKRLEEEEAFRLKTHEAKKNLQRQKKATQKLAHEKMVSRQIAKQFHAKLKTNSYGQLADVGFFFNKFKDNTLKTDVLPWLMKETEMFLDELNQADGLHDTMMDTFINDMSTEHQATINAHNQRREDAEKQAKEEEQARLAAKVQRRQEREANREAEKRGNLRTLVDEEFIKRGKVEEGIIYQDITDIDGFGRKQTPIVSVIGGFIGQLALVLNTVARHYQRLDIPVKSRASSRKDAPSRPQTESSQKDLAKEQSQMSLPPEDPHQILSAKHVQRFLYDFLNEKLKPEKLSIQVDPEFEHMLKNLKVPLELNQIRTMKEPNYSALRDLIRQKAGGYVLNMIRDNQEYLGLEPGVFDLAFEGFWDLYTLHSQVTEVSAKKMQTLVQTKVRLQANEMTGVPAVEVNTEEEPKEGEEPKEAKEAQPPYEPICAVVRIRIAKKAPEPIENDDGEMVEPEVNEDELEEMPIDDKCLAITTNDGEGKSVYCINQAVQRVFRKDLIMEFCNHNEALKAADVAEFCDNCEKDAEIFEDKFIKMFENPEGQAIGPQKVPVFDFTPTV